MQLALTPSAEAASALARGAKAGAREFEEESPAAQTWDNDPRSSLPQIKFDIQVATGGAGFLPAVYAQVGNAQGVFVQTARRARLFCRKVKKSVNESVYLQEIARARRGGCNLNFEFLGANVDPVEALLALTLQSSSWGLDETEVSNVRNTARPRPLKRPSLGNCLVQVGVSVSSLHSPRLAAAPRNLRKFFALGPRGLGWPPQSPFDFRGIHFSLHRSLETRAFRRCHGGERRRRRRSGAQRSFSRQGVSPAVV